MRKAFFALLLVIPLAGCSFGSMFGSADERVDGYTELKATYCTQSLDTYDERECNKFKLQESLADYQEAQAGILAVIQNPDVPDEAKTALREADMAAVEAYRAYTEAILQSAEGSEAALVAALTALQNVQTKLIEIQNEGG